MYTLCPGYPCYLHEKTHVPVAHLDIPIFWVARPLKVSSQDLLSAPSMYDPFIRVCSHSLPVLKVLESKAQRLSHLSALCKVY